MFYLLNLTGSYTPIRAREVGPLRNAARTIFFFNFIAFKSELTVHMCFIEGESFLMDVKYLKLNKEAIESCL